jgi:hypothetical protein
MSDEARARISASMKSKPKTERHKTNISRGLVRMYAVRGKTGKTPAELRAARVARDRRREIARLEARLAKLRAEDG